MAKLLDPFRFLVISLAGWMNQCHLQAIDYLREENRVLREQLGDRRLRLTDDQRRRLAAKAKGLGRKVLAEVATIVKPLTRVPIAALPEHSRNSREDQNQRHPASQAGSCGTGAAPAFCVNF